MVVLLIKQRHSGVNQRHVNTVESPKMLGPSRLGPPFSLYRQAHAELREGGKSQ